MVNEFLKGIIVGLGASIPLGPLGVLCIQKTLSKGRNSGFITGMGGAVSDLFFSALALFGLSFLQQWLTDNEDAVLTFGGVIITVIGLKIFLTNPVKQIRRRNSGNKRYWEDFFSAVLMTVTNPGALFLLLGLFAFVGVNLSADESAAVIAPVLTGVFTGCALWWFGLATLINVFRDRFMLKQLIMINRISGIIIMVLGIISCFEGLFRWVA